jgi:hypothetical protein
MIILRNRAKCLNCGNIIESKHVHNYVVCRCYVESMEAIDNFKGKKYRKKVLNHPLYGNWTKKFYEFVQTLHGISIDGGTDYLRRGFYNIDDFKDLSEVVEVRDC